jgi:hypothetical protein
MLMSLSRLALAIILVGHFWLPAAAQQLDRVDGRVFEAGSNRGIENLEVKVTPPNNSGLPVRIANTDQNGQFRFGEVRQSRYLLEISQGPNLLYRTEIDTGKQSHIEIPLQRR